MLYESMTRAQQSFFRKLLEMFLTDNRDYNPIAQKIFPSDLDLISAAKKRLADLYKHEQDLDSTYGRDSGITNKLVIDFIIRINTLTEKGSTGPVVPYSSDLMQEITQVFSWLLADWMKSVISAGKRLNPSERDAITSLPARLLDKGANSTKSAWDYTSVKRLDLTQKLAPLNKFLIDKLDKAEHRELLLLRLYALGLPDEQIVPKTTLISIIDSIPRRFPKKGVPSTLSSIFQITSDGYGVQFPWIVDEPKKQIGFSSLPSADLSGKEIVPLSFFREQRALEQLDEMMLWLYRVCTPEKRSSSTLHPIVEIYALYYFVDKLNVWMQDFLSPIIDSEKSASLEATISSDERPSLRYTRKRDGGQEPLFITLNISILFWLFRFIDEFESHYNPRLRGEKQNPRHRQLIQLIKKTGSDMLSTVIAASLKIDPEGKYLLGMMHTFEKETAMHLLIRSLAEVERRYPKFAAIKNILGYFQSTPSIYAFITKYWRTIMHLTYVINEGKDAIAEQLAQISKELSDMDKAWKTSFFPKTTDEMYCPKALKQHYFVLFSELITLKSIVDQLRSIIKNDTSYEDSDRIRMTALVRELSSIFSDNSEEQDESESDINTSSSALRDKVSLFSKVSGSTFSSDLNASLVCTTCSCLGVAFEAIHKQTKAGDDSYSPDEYTQFAETCYSLAKRLPPSPTIANELERACTLMRELNHSPELVQDLLTAIDEPRDEAVDTLKLFTSRGLFLTLSIAFNQLLILFTNDAAQVLTEKDPPSETISLLDKLMWLISQALETTIAPSSDVFEALTGTINRQMLLLQIATSKWKDCCPDLPMPHDNESLYQNSNLLHFSLYLAAFHVALNKNLLPGMQDEKLLNLIKEMELNVKKYHLKEIDPKKKSDIQGPFEAVMIEIAKRMGASPRDSGLLPREYCQLMLKGRMETESLEATTTESAKTVSPVVPTTSFEEPPAENIPITNVKPHYSQTEKTFQKSVSYACSLVSQFFPKGSSRDETADESWYDDETISTLLDHYLRDDTDTHFITPCLVQNTETGNTKFSLLEALLEGFQVQVSGGCVSQHRIFIPINLNRSHWILAYVKLPENQEERPQAYYFDSLSRESDPIPQGVLDALRGIGIVKPDQIVNISEPVQHDGHNCGPWIVEMARRLTKEQSDPGQVINVEQARIEHRRIILEREADQSKPIPKKLTR